MQVASRISRITRSAKIKRLAAEIRETEFGLVDPIGLVTSGGYAKLGYVFGVFWAILRPCRWESDSEDSSWA